MAYLGRKGASAALTSADIPDGSVTAAKIATDTIAAGDIAPNAIGASELADDAVDTAAIADSVTLVTPNIGTPSAGVMTNVTGIPAAQVGGVLPIGVTGGSGLTLLGTVVSGVLGAGVALKIHSVNHTTDSGNHDSTGGYNFGTALDIGSLDNPNDAKFIIMCGGGRCYDYNAYAILNMQVKYIEGGASWTSSNGTFITQLIAAGGETTHWKATPQSIGLYENDSGGAVDVSFKTSVLCTGSGESRVYNGDANISSGIIAIRVH